MYSSLNTSSACLSIYSLSLSYWSWRHLWTAPNSTYSVVRRVYVFFVTWFHHLRTFSFFAPIINQIAEKSEEAPIKIGVKSLYAAVKNYVTHTTSGVNFTNILQAAFTSAVPKSAKKTVKLISFIALLGSARVKAARRTLVKLTPDLEIDYRFFSIFFQLFQTRPHAGCESA